VATAPGSAVAVLASAPAAATSAVASGAIPGSAAAVALFKALVERGMDKDALLGGLLDSQRLSYTFYSLSNLFNNYHSILGADPSGLGEKEGYCVPPIIEFLTELCEIQNHLEDNHGVAASHTLSYLLKPETQFVAYKHHAEFGAEGALEWLRGEEDSYKSYEDTFKNLTRIIAEFELSHDMPIDQAVEKITALTLERVAPQFQAWFRKNPEAAAKVIAEYSRYSDSTLAFARRMLESSPDDALEWNQTLDKAVSTDLKEREKKAALEAEKLASAKPEEKPATAISAQQYLIPGDYYKGKVTANVSPENPAMHTNGIRRIGA